MTPDQIIDLRQRILRKEPVSNDELRAALDALRGKRMANAEASVARAERTSAKANSKAELLSIVAGALAGAKKPSA